MFFVFVALLSLIPQALLSITFINSSLNFWINVKIVDVLEGGMKVALEYYSDKYENLKRFHKSPHLEYFLNELNPEILDNKDFSHNPGLIFDKIKDANPDISFIQVFSEEGEEILFRGEHRETMVKDFSEINKKSGFLPKKETEDLSSLRTVSTVRINDTTYYVVFGIVFTKEFSEYASKITAHRSTFKYCCYHFLFSLFPADSPSFDINQLSSYRGDNPSHCSS